MSGKTLCRCRGVRRRDRRRTAPCRGCGVRRRPRPVAMMISTAAGCGAQNHRPAAERLQAGAQAQAPTPYQKSTEKAGNEQKQAAEAWKVNDKKYTQCKGQAAAQKLHLGKRRQFIKKCMAE